MIEFRDVSKRFGRRPALDNLNLTVQKGEICGLLGHNGAGKSTAIGILLGQIWPTGGRVAILGHDVFQDRQQALQQVGAIFETPVFYDYLSGFRNLEILSSYTDATSGSRIMEAMEWVGLGARAKSKVRTYSHGMRARLALAQALLPHPDLLILDEPGDGLDPEGTHELRQTIRRLHRELGLTILLSSHLLSEVEQICTRISVLKEGRLVFDGSVDEATRHQGWVRLRTDGFVDAVKALHQAGLITGHRNGDSVQLTDGVRIEAVVRFLVRRGKSVHEIAPQEQTLEDFYLSVMKQPEASP